MVSLDSFRRPTARLPLPRLADRFGVRDLKQVSGDLAQLVRGVVSGARFQFDVRSAGLVRPDLSLPTYAGLVPSDGLAPIYNLFDRSSGQYDWYTTRVSRRRARDFRGGKLAYDDHDGTDFVCPIGMPVTAAAPGTVVLLRDYWLRGGLTLTIDHGDGLLTSYSHLAEAVARPGVRVRRGEVVGVAGASGVDLVSFFPWVPPHIHFTTWLDGRPVDPFAAPGEASLWVRANEPLPGEELVLAALGDEPLPSASPIDELALERLCSHCEDESIAREIAALRDDAVQLAAFLDDAMFHQPAAWPRAFWGQTVRPARDGGGPPAAQLSLPLPASDYQGARFADAPWTAPDAG
ncbi:MAG: M23 family metallopeptidase [Myxococcales bacterium]|nr:M23 family metallopeptidase [Myxococcales bacterium]